MGLGEQKQGFCVGLVVVVVCFAVFAAFWVPFVRNDDDDDDDNTTYTKPVDTYVSRMSASKVMGHLQDLQNIASDNNDTRAVATSGYKASVDYIVSQLKSGNANCDPKTQSFEIADWQSLETPVFAQVDPAIDFSSDLYMQILTYSGSGDITASLGVLPADNMGCTQGAWSGVDVKNKIALVIRGECDFHEKATAAFGAGALGVLIYNDGTSEERMGPFAGTLGELQPGPVFSLSHSVGNQISNSPNQFLMQADTQTTVSETWNVICEWKDGEEENTIVVGSHLDSVPAGPGINDNGSGSSMNLELAIQLANSPVEVKNRVIFAWWGAEEIGLKGSDYFVQNAKANGDLSDIQLNLNFDMIGSPNARLEIYQGTAVLDPLIKPGCVAIQSIFEQYFDIADIEFTTVDKLNGAKSDYAPFTTNGIPAGGLSTGNADIKDADERTIFGGYANAAYDPCYHMDCDNVDNIDQDAVQANSQAAAYTLGTLASSPQLSSLLNFDSTKRDQIRKDTTKRVFASI
uniref:Peptide hydrolase n=1 Tax=Paramoeba aestuarina TaxID=180227 RepID=A0A7S4KE34_9EUKA|mmetsp:Transcript_17659/g.27646  ORF Transcript_17659/g.27646 Transcript_17659/m.27646 type:complete len:518 (+) Transcript_17659:46-1599(+)